MRGGGIDYHLLRLRDRTNDTSMLPVAPARVAAANSTCTLFSSSTHVQRETYVLLVGQPGEWTLTKET